MSWELHKSVCIIKLSELGTVPYSFPCFSADGQWQKRLHRCTRWEWKNGFWTCSGLDVTTGHVTACHWFIFPHSHKQISANHLSVLACRDATSSERQSSSLHSGFVFTVLDYRCQQWACTAIGNQQAEEYLACSLISQKNQATTHCFPQSSG